jgi:hypothetical protein
LPPAASAWAFLWKLRQGSDAPPFHCWPGSKNLAADYGL